MIKSRNDQPDAKIYGAGAKIERVKQFKYLGCLLNDKCDPESEIKVLLNKLQTPSWNCASF